MDNHGLKHLIKDKTPHHEQFIKNCIDSVLGKYVFKLSTDSIFTEIINDISLLIDSGKRLHGIREFRVMIPNDTSYRIARGECWYTLTHTNPGDYRGYVQTFNVVF